MKKGPAKSDKNCFIHYSLYIESDSFSPDYSILAIAILSLS